MESSAPASGSLQLRPGQMAAIVGVFIAGFAIWILPYILGPIAVICGVVAYVRGERRGLWVIGLAVVCMGLGFLVHAIPDDIVGG
jgi:hypothetical protein